mmetsp:Transcript_59695/g.129298  ORF Transcript_59695/g.129298 Transcript_59695/m.129298 type:complete len:101 (+) Transcript_59695:1035-1337(+)
MTAAGGTAATGAAVAPVPEACSAVVAAAVAPVQAEAQAQAELEIPTPEAGEELWAPAGQADAQERDGSRNPETRSGLSAKSPHCQRPTAFWSKATCHSRE